MPRLQISHNMNSITCYWSRQVTCQSITERWGNRCHLQWEELQRLCSPMKSIRQLCSISSDSDPRDRGHHSTLCRSPLLILVSKGRERIWYPRRLLSILRWERNDFPIWCYTGLNWINQWYDILEDFFLCLEVGEFELSHLWGKTLCWLTTMYSWKINHLPLSNGRRLPKLPNHFLQVVVTS